MKHFLTLCLVALTALALTACGSRAGAGSSTGSSAAASEPAASAPAPERTPPQPTVTISKNTDRYQSNDDKVTLLNSEWNTAVISIPGNQRAQAAIQADLDQITKTFQATSQDYYQEAADYYKDEGQNNDPSAYSAYYHGLTLTRARCDSTVISLIFDEANFTGGAHGIDYRYARNYDAATGQVLTLAELGDGFKEAASDRILQLGNLIHEKEGLFFDQMTKADLNDVVADDMFYFDKNGLVFISGQYVLQNYAEGIVEFTVSYDDLKGTLLDTYNLGGGSTQCSTQLGVYSFQADGSLDTSQINSAELYQDDVATTS